jgi:hypothetical protein
MTAKQEPERQYIVSLDCSHSQVLSASKLMKPVRRDHYTRTAYFLCPSCYRRERGACSIDPVHRVRSITEIPPSLRRKVVNLKQ